MGENGTVPCDASLPPSGATALEERLGAQQQAVNPWVTVVWDDPVNLMSYVTHVFCSYFHYPRSQSERLMMQVHMEGRAIVSSGGREEMERDVNAMHGFGLWATLDRAE